MHGVAEEDVRMALDERVFYRLVGAKIRAARLRLRPKLSQEKLAASLHVSRASIVNIEAGRQHPPLHVLWRIAEALQTEAALLLPTYQEYAAEDQGPLTLDAATLAQIDAVAGEDAKTRRLLEQFVSRVWPKKD